MTRSNPSRPSSSRLDRGRLAALDHVGHQRAGHLGADAGQLVRPEGGLDEDGVGPGRLVGAGPVDGGVEAFHRPGVGAGDDHQIGISPGFDGADSSLASI